MKVELKIDIDGKLKEKEIIKRLFLLQKFLQFKGIGIDKKKTKHGWHLRFGFTTERELDDRDIVFLQLFLGSDRNRELFNILRVWSGCKIYNVLFREKCDSSGKVISYER
jgi:hypothetical protein